MDRNQMSPDEMEVYLQYVQTGYETAGSLTPCSDMKKSEEKIRIKFLITAWGIECVCVSEKEDGTEEYSEFMIDKEYFMGTPLWKYMEPDFILGVDELEDIFLAAHSLPILLSSQQSKHIRTS